MSDAANRSPAPRAPFNRSHWRAVDAALDAAAGRRALALIIGAEGVGRSAVMEEIAESLPAKARAVRISGGAVNRERLATALAGALGSPDPAAQTQTLTDMRDAGERLTLLVDAAFGVSGDVLRGVGRLHERFGVASVVIARPALAESLRTAKKDDIRALGETAFTLRDFDLEETEALAGRRAPALGVDGAKALQAWTAGVPELLQEALDAFEPAWREATRVAGPEAAVDPATVLVDVLRRADLPSRLSALRPDAPAPELAAPAAAPGQPEPLSQDEVEGRDAGAPPPPSVETPAEPAPTAPLQAEARARPSAPDAADIDMEIDEALDAILDEEWADDASRPRRLRLLGVAAGVAAGVALMLFYGSSGLLEGGLWRDAASEIERPAPEPIAEPAPQDPAAFVTAAPVERADLAAPAGSAESAAANETAGGDAAGATLATADVTPPAVSPTIVLTVSKPAETLETPPTALATVGEGDASAVASVAAETGFGAAAAAGRALAGADVLPESVAALAGQAADLAFERQRDLSRARRLDDLAPEDVDALVARAAVEADRRIAAERLTGPAGQSAYDVLLDAWEVAPEDPRLTLRFERLISHYRAQSRSALAQERFSEFYRLNQLIDRIVARRPV